MAFLEVHNLGVAYRGSGRVLFGLSFDVARNEFLSLLGPSGCGKTTTLRSLAGFLEPQEGEIILKGKDYTHIPPYRRNFGLVYQNYALFPHLTVFKNVAFGLEMRKVPKANIHEKVREALALVNLAELEDRLPRQLSGGQQQRVALARALVVEPDLLLLDEPLSNLDAKLRTLMRSELRRLQKEVGITTIYVTHDQAESLALSDRIIVLNHGKIEQMGSPEELFYSPQTLFVADFMGYQRIADGKVIDRHERFAEIQVDNFVITAKADQRIGINDRVAVVARPGSFKLLEEEKTEIKGRIISKIFQGETVSYVVSAGSHEFRVEVPLQFASWRENDIVSLSIDPDLCIAYPWS